MEIRFLKLAMMTILFGVIASTGFGGKNGLLAHYDFDTTDSQNRVADLSGNDRLAQLVGNGIELVPGIAGMAARCNGARDSWIAAPNPDRYFDTSQSMTLAAWVKRSDVGSNWDGIVCNGSGKGGYQLLFNDCTQNLTLYLNTTQSGYQPAVGAYLPMNEWVHVAASYDATNGRVELFQNGKLTATVPMQGAVTQFGTDLLIGKSAYAGAFRGWIDEVRVYGRALSTDEVKTLFDEFAGARGENADRPELKPFLDGISAERRADCNGVSLTLTLASDVPPTTTASLKILRGEAHRSDVNPGTENAKVVFDGELTSRDGVNFVFFDRIVSPKDGCTYYYWAKPSDAQDIRVAPGRVRFYDPQQWWSPNRIMDDVKRIAMKNPRMAKVVHAGNTVQGRPLDALQVGNAQRYIVLVGAMHVSESGPELMLPIIEQMIQEQPELLAKVGIVAVPCMTLDERQRLLSTGNPFYFRGNANGVDLNRNFDGFWYNPGEGYNKRSTNPKDETYGGPSAFSEPESRALANLLKRGQPLAIFSMHSVNGFTNAGFLYSRPGKDDAEYKAASEQVFNLYAHAMYGDKTEKYAFCRPEGPNGSLPTWGFESLKVPTFDLELDNNPDARLPAVTDTCTPELMTEFRRLHKQGMIAVMEHFAK